MGCLGFDGWKITKSRLRRKKTAAMGSSEKELRRNRRRSPVCSLKLLPQPTLRGSSLWLRRSPSCASGFDFACMELPTICHLRWRVSPLALPLRRPKKNRFAEKELRLLQTGQYRVRRPMGEFAFLGVFRSHDMAVGRSYRFAVTIQLCNNMGALSVGMLF